jgi:UDP-glucose 4-epimerase
MSEDNSFHWLHGKRILVTGSSGHLGEALVRTLQEKNCDVIGMDVLPSKFTHHIGTVVDPTFLNRCMQGVQIVFHACTLHKPHVATHSRQSFVDVNITGTLNLLEAAIQNKVEAFVFTSSTSVFGDALVPPDGSAAAWITETVVPIPKNIYGITKTAAEDLCQLFHRLHKLPAIVLRTSRFFPEDDDNEVAVAEFDNENLKAIEFLYRRVDIEDVVSAHVCAAKAASRIGFGKYIISATSPFQEEDLNDLRLRGAEVMKKYYPDYEQLFATLHWKPLPSFDRVYVNTKARMELGWKPEHSFASILDRLQLKKAVEGDDEGRKIGKEIWSSLAKQVGVKGYHRSVEEAEAWMVSQE